MKEGESLSTADSITEVYKQLDLKLGLTASLKEFNTGVLKEKGCVLSSFPVISGNCSKGILLSYMIDRIIFRNSLSLIWLDDTEELHEVDVDISPSSPDTVDIIVSGGGWANISPGSRDEMKDKNYSSEQISSADPDFTVKYHSSLVKAFKQSHLALLYLS